MEGLENKMLNGSRTNKNRITNLSAALKGVIILGLILPGVASAGSYAYDGIVDPTEYANSFTTEWYNDHESGPGKGSQFPEGGGQTTTVYWEEVGSEFRMGLLAPLSVKSMIWGDFVSNATDPSPAWDQALLYYQHWCSPSGGATAALDGSNCNHHADGFDAANASDPGHPEKTFLETIGSADFKTMVDSEKVKIDTTNFRLIDSKAGAKSISNGSYKTSLTYILDDANDALFPNCSDASCDAVSTAMSFEFLWTTASVGEAFKN